MRTRTVEQRRADVRRGGRTVEARKTQAATPKTQAAARKTRAAAARHGPRPLRGTGRAGVERREAPGDLRDAARIESSPTTELEYSTPFELLIAVMLSAQATDVSVNKATRSLFAVAATPEAMLALGEDGVRAHVRNIGLFNAKAKNVVATCRLLLDLHGGGCRTSAKRWSACPVSGARPPTWC